MNCCKVRDSSAGLSDLPVWAGKSSWLGNAKQQGPRPALPCSLRTLCWQKKNKTMSFKRGIGKHRSLINWVPDFPKCRSALSSYVFCIEWWHQRAEVEANLAVRYTSRVRLSYCAIVFKAWNTTSVADFSWEPETTPTIFPTSFVCTDITFIGTVLDAFSKGHYFWMTPQISVWEPGYSLFKLLLHFGWQAEHGFGLLWGHLRKNISLLYQSLVVPIGQLSIRTSDQMVSGWSDLCRDLLHDVNKEVNLPVQLGTVQKHGLQLFDGRVHNFICNTTTRQLTTRRENVQALIMKNGSCKTMIRMQGRSFGFMTNEIGANEDKCIDLVFC